MRYTALSLIVVILAVSVSASWLRPNNLSPDCPTHEDGGFMRPVSSDLCNECCTRCYALHFRATVVDGSITNTAYCNVNGEACPVWVFFRVSPCCQCDGLEQTESISACGIDGRNRTTQTQSLCQIKNLTILVGPNHESTSSLFPGCDSEDVFMAKYGRSSDMANEHYTVVAIDTCSDSPGGGSLQYVYNAYHDGPRFPDTCFADSHLVSSLMTSAEGLLASSLIVYGPTDTNSVWLSANLSGRAPLPIPCRKWHELLDDECQSTSADSAATIAAHAVSQVGAPQLPKPASKKAQSSSETVEDESFDEPVPAEEIVPVESVAVEARAAVEEADNAMRKSVEDFFVGAPVDVVVE